MSLLQLVVNDIDFAKGLHRNWEHSLSMQTAKSKEKVLLATGALSDARKHQSDCRRRLLTFVGSGFLILVLIGALIAALVVLKMV